MRKQKDHPAAGPVDVDGTTPGSSTAQAASLSQHSSGGQEEAPESAPHYAVDSSPVDIAEAAAEEQEDPNVRFEREVKILREALPDACPAGHAVPWFLERAFQAAAKLPHGSAEGAAMLGVTSSFRRWLEDETTAALRLLDAGSADSMAAFKELAPLLKERCAGDEAVASLRRELAQLEAEERSWCGSACCPRCTEEPAHPALREGLTLPCGFCLQAGTAEQVLRDAGVGGSLPGRCAIRASGAAARRQLARCSCHPKRGTRSEQPPSQHAGARVDGRVPLPQLFCRLEFQGTKWCCSSSVCHYLPGE
jgi:hypothetical protein